MRILRKLRNGSPRAGAGPQQISSEVPPQRAEAAAPSAKAPAAPWDDSRFLKACRRERTDATPVWLMRQAGRYMREYRELRARAPFLEVCKNPDLVAEITITAAAKIGADAAIIFADLLLIAEPLGFSIEYEKGEGPILRPPLREGHDVDRIRDGDLLGALDYFYEGIRKTRAQLNPQTPLIGFAGAPFTLASYLIEGGASRAFPHTKRLMYSDAGAWRALMERLTVALSAYVQEQITAGVQAVQIFDTWVGCLAPADYREFVQPYSKKLFEQIGGQVPLIHFAAETATLLEAMRDAGGDIIGLDHRIELGQAWQRLGPEVGVQGNLDPAVLLGPQPIIRRRVEDILRQAGGRPGHIFNLGHGVLPQTPFENAVELVKMVHAISGEKKAREKRSPSAAR